MALSDVLSLVTVPDPHGNGQDSVEVHYTDPASGAVIKSGCFLSVHGGGPLHVRFVHGNPGPSATAGTVFEIDPTSHRVAISEL